MTFFAILSKFVNTFVIADFSTLTKSSFSMQVFSYSLSSCQLSLKKMNKSKLLHEVQTKIRADVSYI